MGESDLQDHLRLWERSSRTFHLLGPPLRPSGEDVSFYWEMVREWIEARGAPRVLLLGVTPELYRLPWPEGTDLVATDCSQAMIDTVWPGPKEAARCCDWLSLDLPEGSRDIVLCDGGLHLLSYPQGQKALIRTLHGILAAGGLCIFRLFAMPAEKETPEAVLRDLQDGNIKDTDTLRIRLLMALQDNPEAGVALGDVHRRLMEGIDNLEELQTMIGWTEEYMRPIHNFKGLRYRYYILRPEQVTDMFRADPGGFQVHRIFTPSCVLGDRFPTIGFKRLADNR